jgi:hypothetical protein
MLPPNCIYKDLMCAVGVHRLGRVWQTVISPLVQRRLFGLDQYPMGWPGLDTRQPV